MRFIKKNEEVLGLSICKKGQIMENQKNEFDDIILEKSNKSEKVKKILDVKENEKIVGFIHMGYFNEAPEPKERIALENKFTRFEG